MRLKAVESENLKAFGYDSINRELWVQFHYGDQIYRYKGVPPNLYRGLRRAKSKGKYFAARIRVHFPYKRIEAPMDLTMLTSPNQWPRWPVLPLKRTFQQYTPNTGCLIEASGLYNKKGPVTVFTGPEANVFQPVQYILDHAERKVYASLQAVLDDGWVVD